MHIDKHSKQEQGGGTPCPLAVGDRISPMPTTIGHTCSCYYTVMRASFQDDWQAVRGVKLSIGVRYRILLSNTSHRFVCLNSYGYYVCRFS